MIKKYKLVQPKNIDAIQYNGENLDEIYDFVGTNLLSLKGINLLKKGDFVVKTDENFSTYDEETFKKYYIEV